MIGYCTEQPLQTIVYELGFIIVIGLIGLVIKIRQAKKQKF